MVRVTPLYPWIILLVMITSTLIYIVTPAVADTITYTSQPTQYTLPENISCPPGYYGYNITGGTAYICVPETSRINTSLSNIIVVYNDTGVYVLASTIDPRGSSLYITITLPNGTDIATINTTLPPNTAEWIVASTGNYTSPYIVVNATVNGFNAGIYAITKKTPPIADISSLSSISPLVPLLFTVAVFAPLIGIMMRGNIRTGAIGMIAIAIIYTPLMYALGINTIVVGFVSSLLVVIALIILALNPR